jgi:tetratricopeptide (TPR) repeat protein
MVLWFLNSSGRRRGRGTRRALRLLQAGKWDQALEIVQQLQRGVRPGAYWEGRLRNAEGECRRAAGVQAVLAKDFEQALQHHSQAAALLNVNPAEVRASVLERMLAETRALYADRADDAAVAMAGRLLTLEPGQGEAHFWAGLCHARQGRWDKARQAFDSARVSDAKTEAPVEPPLYLAAVLLRQGLAKEALRYASEANRIDGNCPLVALQLGTCMVHADVDGSLATRALTRALGERGLPAFFSAPEKMWTEGLPEGKSYIRKLTAKHRFHCPLWGDDPRALAHHGRMMLGQANFKLGHFQQAADVFQKILDESPPSHDVLRWLGLTLARLERYHDAFKHLKTALELETPPDRLTTGYLALCAARGKPDKPEDKGPNVAWAVRTIRQFTAFGDRDWVAAILGVFEEARGLNMALSAADHTFLCDHLASIHATLPSAAAAYHLVAVEHPEALKPVYAWLYCRAAQEHSLDDDRALQLYATTLQTASDARTYYAAHNWDFDELDYSFLKQAAVRAPGSFPTVLGADYSLHAEAILDERSARLERENQLDAALAAVDVWVRLAPTSSQALDRFAYLHHKRGNLEIAANLLQHWCDLESANPIPWAKLAAVQQQQGSTQQALHSLNNAIERASGTAQADLACLAAKLVLSGKDGAAAFPLDPSVVSQSQSYLQRALRSQCDHARALWLKAALHAITGDTVGLAALSGTMRRVESVDPRFSYFAALSHLQAGDPAAALTAATRAAGDPAFKVEAAYVAGWASLQSKDVAGATDAMRIVADTPTSKSCSQARAILGGIRFHEGAPGDAIQWWQGIGADQLAALNLAKPLQQSLFLDGLQALAEARFEFAVGRFREAGLAGLRERSLGGLLQYALIKAGQRLLYARGEA